MLNGIGGRTIAEARENISYGEYLIWAEYRAKRGSLNVGRRVEQATGQLHYTTVRLNTKQGTQLDILAFMPHEDQPVAKEVDAMDALRAWAGV